jgi:hypothetical protein
VYRESSAAISPSTFWAPRDGRSSGISRHKHDLPKGVKHIAVDLTDEEAVKPH